MAEKCTPKQKVNINIPESSTEVSYQARADSGEINSSTGVTTAIVPPASTAIAGLEVPSHYSATESVITADVATQIYFGTGSGPTSSSKATFNESTGELYIDGKLTVTGLIDPTGIVLDFESPTNVPTGASKGAFFVGDGTAGSLSDTPYYKDSSGTLYNLLSASNTFLSLTDTPSSYAGQGLRAIRVNSIASALEFFDTPATSDLPYGPSWNTNTDAATKNAIYDKIEALEVDLDIDDLKTLTGVAGGSTDLGTFTGVTITDNVDIKVALQELETAVEGVVGGADEKVGVDALATPDYIGATGADGVIRVDSTLDYVDGGNFVTISLDSTLKSNYDAAHTHSTGDGSDHQDVVDLVTLTGVAANSTDLGTFTGTTITDSVTIKVALQELETAVEGISGVTNLGYTASPTDGTVTSDTGTDATLPLANTTNAGLLSPGDWDKLSFISITQAVDLDALETASHAAVTLSGTGTYLTLVGQDIQVDPITESDISDLGTIVTLNTDTDVSGNSWVLDEDTLVSDSAIKLATQQSIKAYVDAQVGANYLNITTNTSPAQVATTYYIDASLNPVELELPDVSAANDGQFIRAIATDVSNAVTVTTVGGLDLIGGATTQNIKTVNKGFTVQSDNTSGVYHIIQDSRGLGLFDSGSTYETVADQVSLSTGRGIVTGGVLSDGGLGTVDVTGGQAQLRTGASETEPKVMLDFSGSTGLALTDTSTNFVYLDRNGGSPTIGATTSPAAVSGDAERVVLGFVYRDGNDVYITNFQMPSQEATNKIAQRLFFTEGLTRQSGLTVTETGTRNIAMTSGFLWLATDQYSIASFDTSIADTFTYYYRDGIGGWTEVATQTTINNTQYDNDTGTLATLSNNKYGVHWVYTDVNDITRVVYGQGDYTLQEAQDALIPSELPPFFQNYHVFLVAKIIIQKSAASFTEIQIPFETVFQAGVASAHSDLSGLTIGDDHTQYAFLAGRTGGQTLIGGDAGGNDLTLRSTSAGSKGNVIVEGLQFADEDDPTKIIDLATAAITTATTRTWTIPDRNLDFSSGGTFAENSHTHPSTDITDFSEAVDDRVAVLIQDGTGITWTYDDVGNTLTGNVSITQYTDEQAQDAVGTILTDTASIDFTYDDVGNQISAVVLPAGVDHDSLNNYVSDEHVAHSGVTLTAGTGLSGGGDITTNRTFDLDIPSLPALTDAGVIASTDTFALYNTSATAHEEATVSQLQTYMQNNLSFAATSHTHTASDITDFDTEVSNNTDVAANTAARHDAVTFAGTGTYISLAGQVITVDPITESDISDLQPYLLNINSETLSDLSDIPVEPTGGSSLYFLQYNDTGDVHTWELLTSIDHDTLANFVANEHIDWTGATDNFKTTGTIEGPSLNLTADSNQIVLDSDAGAGVTTTITDSATVARVITLPDDTTTLVGTGTTQTLTSKTIDANNNTLSNIHLGLEASWNAIGDISDRTAFASGDKIMIFEAGVGMRKIDYDDLPSGGASTWIGLTDTDPASYAGSAGYLVRVNATPDGLEFVDGTTLFSDVSHGHTLVKGATDVTATAAEVNILDLSATALTTGWVYAADGVSTASWRQLLGSEISNDQGWNNYSHPNHTGDVTSTGDGVTVISAGAVDIAMLSATGTPSSSTFLRGDNVWATPAGGFSDFDVGGDSGVNQTINSGDLLDITGGTGIITTVSKAATTVTLDIDLAVDELAEKTGNLVASDRLTGTSGTTNFSETISNIPLSIFNNDSGWTSNAGTVTDVIGGTGVSSTGGATPSIALTVDELAEKTGALVGTDRLTGTSGTTNFSETISGIPLSIFNNDEGWITASSSDTLTNKTIDGDNNTISNLDIGNEVNWAAAADVTDRTAFASGDKLLIFEAGVGLRKIDYDDLPSGGGGGMVTGVSKNSGANVNAANRSVLNFIEGSNITLTITDDAGGDEVDITIASSGGSGVTSVAAGNGMDFTTITTTGSVTMGTPSTLTGATTNALTATSHTHAITTAITDNSIVGIDSTTVTNGEYARFTASGLESRSAAEAKTDLGFISDVVDDTTPQLGGDLDLNDKAFTLELTGGATIAIRQLCTLDTSLTDGEFYLADADSESLSSSMLVIAAEAGSDGVTSTFYTYGRISGFSGLTAGDVYFISTTAGAITNTAPTATGDFVRVVGYALSSTVLFFNPSSTWIELR